jgi:hypothetical protein
LYYSRVSYRDIILNRFPCQLLEKEKRLNLLGQQHRTSTPHAHAPGWNESLATASEAGVKVRALLFPTGSRNLTYPPFPLQADKSTVDPADLQAETVAYVQRRHGSLEDVPTAATNIRDTVDGPLGLSGGLASDRVDGPLGQKVMEEVSEKADVIVKKTVETVEKVVKPKA